MTTQTHPVSTPIIMGDKAQGFTQKGEASPIVFIAPIDLEIGDLCTVDISDGYLFRIERNGEIVWSDILHGP